MRKISLAFAALLLLTVVVQAALTPAKQQKILAGINQLAAPHGKKVGVAFIDFKSGWQFAVNGTAEFPAASVDKVAVMAAAYHLAELKELELNQQVVYKESDKLGGAGVLQWMKAGKLYTLRNLIRLMIVLSDNTATKMVVETIGLDRINAYLKSINITQTTILDPTMLKERPAPNINLTTPWDMVHIMYRIDNSHHVFTNASAKEMLSYLKNQRYRWGIWRGVAPGTVVADKTGQLEGVLNDVGIVYTKSGKYFLGVFTQGFTQKRQARELINNISKVIFEEYTGTKLQKPKALKGLKGKKATKKKRVIKKR